MRVLVTRPRAEAERTGAELRARGHEVLMAPVLTIEPVTDATFDPTFFDGIVMTSGNAARALAMHPSLQRCLALPVVAVGAQTAQAARDAGFSAVSADGDAIDLLALIQDRWAAGVRLLYLAGSDRSRDLADLAPAGIHVETVVVYSAEAADRLPEGVEDEIRDGALDGVLHYSRRSTKIFLDCVDAGGLGGSVQALTHYCL